MKKYLIKAFLFFSVICLCMYYYNSKDFEIITIDNIETFEEAGEKYVYFGRDTCPTCVEFKENLNQFKDILPNTLYYYDTDYWRGIDDEAMHDLCDQYKVTTVPTVVIIKDGKYSDSFDIKELMKNRGIITEED